MYNRERERELEKIMLSKIKRRNDSLWTDDSKRDEIINGLKKRKLKKVKA